MHYKGTYPILGSTIMKIMIPTVRLERTMKGAPAASITVIKQHIVRLACGSDEVNGNQILCVDAQLLSPALRWPVRSSLMYQ